MVAEKSCQHYSGLHSINAFAILEPLLSMSKVKPIVFNNNVLRDGHQSLAATRMRTEQMTPLFAPLDSLGYGALETWGGATIDSGLRFLDEFPFDRLDTIRKHTKTPHMMLLRGQNIVAYSQMPDDVVTAFVKKSAEHGMDIFRIFDALNDTRNLQTAIKAVKDAGKHAQGTICYTKSPVHNVEGFVKLGAELQDMGCASVVIKDMAGLVPPFKVAEIITGLKKQLKIPVWFHTHDTTGIGAAAYLAAIDAGVDAVDVSIVPFANGTGQPDHKRMHNLLEGHPRKPDYNEDTLMDIRVMLEKIYGELGDFTSHKNEVVDSDAMTYEVPGGMLSNFRKQLKDLKMEDRFEDVFKEIPVVREALGWIPLVTPTSQIVGVQAVMNVKFGRWENFTPAAMDVILGYFGRTPAPVDKEVQKIAAKKSGKDPITERPADLIAPEMDNLRKQLKDKGLPNDDEHCVIYKMFAPQLEKHYENKRKPAEAPAPSPVAAAPAAQATPASQPASAPAAPYSGPGKRMTLSVDGERHEVIVEEV